METVTKPVKFLYGPRKVGISSPPGYSRGQTSSVSPRGYGSNGSTPHSSNGSSYGAAAAAGLNGYGAMSSSAYMTPHVGSHMTSHMMSGTDYLAASNPSETTPFFFLPSTAACVKAGYMHAY